MTNIREEFAYLNRLRESGIVNMFGASGFLQGEFGITNQEARQILGEWMRWVESNPSNRDL